MQDFPLYQLAKTETSPENTTTVQLLIGQEVLQLLSDERFRSGWDMLFEKCDWATAFQSRGFVSSWYRVFQQDYVPVLVLAESAGQLTGLLTMAIDTKDLARAGTRKVTLIGAGKFEAEYQVWLASRQNSDVFILLALDTLRARFPGCDILFRYLPPDTPLGWLQQNNAWQQQSIVQSFTRPLLELDSPELAGLLRLSGQHKTKVNRLKRLGDLRFEHVTDSHTFQRILPDLANQFDFRQGVMFNKNPFRSNPLREKLMLELFEEGVLHATVLKVGEDIIASMVAAKGKGWVHLQGINTHSPLYARHSPGILHFFMLGNLLAEQGYAVFDLTPGGDTYKERFATRHDQVYSLAITQSTTFKLKRRLRTQVHNRLIKAGKRPMGVEVEIKKWLYLLKHNLKLAKQYGLRSVLTRQKANMPDQFESVELVPALAIPVEVNDLNHLLRYNGKGGHLSRWQFLEDAMKRMEAGQSVYTCSAEDSLLCVAWVAGTPEAASGSRLQLEGIYCHPAGKDRFADFLTSLAATLGYPAIPMQAALQVDGHNSQVWSALDFSKTTAVQKHNS